MADPTAMEQIVAFFAVVQDPRRQHATTAIGHTNFWGRASPVTSPLCRVPPKRGQ